MRAKTRNNLRRSARRAFTLVELLVAGVIAAFVIGSVTLSMQQIGRAKNTCKTRYDAHMRADVALTAIRRDIASIVRTDDLFYTRFLLIDGFRRTPDGPFDRDELLVFSNRLRPLRNIDFRGEGVEYETHYRIEEDQYGPALWDRRDPFPDEFPAGGGIATPIVDGMLGLTIQAYDGTQWYDDWDSDIWGLPVAVRVWVTAAGNRGDEDVYTAPRAFLRTTIAIDRVLSSKDQFIDPEAAAEEAGAMTDTDGDGIPDAPDEDGTEPPPDVGSIPIPPGGGPPPDGPRGPNGGPGRGGPNPPPGGPGRPPPTNDPGNTDDGVPRGQGARS